MGREEDIKADKKKKKKEDTKEVKKKKKKDAVKDKDKKQKHPTDEKRERKEKKEKEKKEKKEKGKKESKKNAEGEHQIDKSTEDRKHESKKLKKEKKEKVKDGKDRDGEAEKDRKKKLKKDKAKNKDVKQTKEKNAGQKDKKSSKKTLNVKETTSKIDKKSMKEKDDGGKIKAEKKALNDFIKKGKKVKSTDEKKVKAKKKEKLDKSSSKKDEERSSESKSLKSTKEMLRGDNKQSESSKKSKDDRQIHHNSRLSISSPSQSRKSPKRTSRQSPVKSPDKVSTNLDQSMKKTEMKLVASNISAPPLVPSGLDNIEKENPTNTTTAFKDESSESSESADSFRASASDDLLGNELLVVEKLPPPHDSSSSDSSDSSESSSRSSKLDETYEKSSIVLKNSKPVVPLEDGSSASSGTSSGSSKSLQRKKHIRMGGTEIASQLGTLCDVPRSQKVEKKQEKRGLFKMEALDASPAVATGSTPLKKTSYEHAKQMETLSNLATDNVGQLDVSSEATKTHTLSENKSIDATDGLGGSSELPKNGHIDAENPIITSPDRTRTDDESQKIVAAQEEAEIQPAPRSNDPPKVSDVGSSRGSRNDPFLINYESSDNNSVNSESESASSGQSLIPSLQLPRGATHDNKSDQNDASMVLSVTREGSSSSVKSEVGQNDQPSNPLDDPPKESSTDEEADQQKYTAQLHSEMSNETSRIRGGNNSDDCRFYHSKLRINPVNIESSINSVGTDTNRNTDDQDQPVVLSNEQSLKNGQENQHTLLFEKSNSSIASESVHQVERVNSLNDSPRLNVGGSDSLFGKMSTQSPDRNNRNIDSDVDRPNQSLTSPDDILEHKNIQVDLRDEELLSFRVSGEKGSIDDTDINDVITSDGQPDHTPTLHGDPSRKSAPGSQGGSVDSLSRPVASSVGSSNKISVEADQVDQISKEASIEFDRSSHHIVSTLDLPPFGEVLKECTLEVNHPSQPPVTKKGSFKDYDHSNFRLTAGEEEEDPCLSMIAEGKGGKCELRHHAHWGVAAARYSTHRSGVILFSTTLCLGASPDIKTSTVLQIVHTSYAMPIVPGGRGGCRNKLFEKTPLLQITWCRNNQQSSSDEEDAYLLWANMRRRNKEHRYKIGPVNPGEFFDLDLWIVFDADSERFELGIDVDEDNRLLKTVDDWLSLTPTSYFQMGCQINNTMDEDEKTPSDTSMQMLFKKLDINIPSGEPIGTEEDTDDDSDEDDEESEDDDSEDCEDDTSMAEISVESSDDSDWEEEFVSDGDSSSSSDSGSDESDDDSDIWAEESIEDMDESSSGSDTYSSEKDKGNGVDNNEVRWAELSLPDEESDGAKDKKDIEDSARPAGFSTVKEGEEEEIIEYYDCSSGSDYSAESVSEVTVHSSGSAYYIGLDESNEKDLSKLADRKQIDFVIARKRTDKQENYRGYSKVAVWTDLTVSVYQAVKSACSGTRIFVLGKRVKQKIKNGEMVGYITYGTGENIRKVSFAACKKTLLAQAIDDVLPVTETTLSILITYEEVASVDDEEEELSD